MEHFSGCLICGEELVYAPSAEQRKCMMCGDPFSSNVACGRGHFVCDRCHNKDAIGSISAVCLEYLEGDPLELTNRLLSLPSVNMHGPEHHFLVPAVLLTIMSRELGKSDQLQKWLQIASERSANVPGGFCGTHGNCGACVGTGTALSILTGSTPLSGESWKATNRLTGECLILVAEHGGPRCCKRDSFLAIQHSFRTLNRRFDTNVPVPDKIACKFAEHNRQCIGSICPFFKS